MKNLWQKKCRQFLGLVLAAGMVLTGMGITPMRAQAEEGTQTVYRLYNESNQEHLYTTDANEVVVLAKHHGWTYEGTAWDAPTSGTPVYRLYNQALDNHLYTSDMNEVTILTERGDWTMDNNWQPLFYSGGEVPVYRLYKKELRGMHFLTTDLNEYNVLATEGYGSWTQEGVGFNCVVLGSPDYPAPGDITPDTPAPAPAPTAEAARWDISFNWDGDVWAIWEYDKNWNSTKSTYYDDMDGSVSSYTIYARDENGRQIGGTSYDKDNQVLRSWKSVYVDGEFVGTDYFKADGTLDYYYREFYSEDRLTERDVYYNPDQTVQYYYVYENAADRSWSKSTYYEADGTSRSWTMTSYNITGEYDRYPTKRTSYRADGTRQWEEVYRPNSWQFETDTYYAEDGETVTNQNVYRYDDNGNEIGYDSYYEGKLNWSRRYERDEHGYTVKETEMNADGVVTSVVAIEYAPADENGNRRRVKTTYYGYNNVLARSYTYEYAENGRPVRWTKFDENGNAVRVTEY